jgi:dihydropyrimidine dehydrogenase (NAD+) subunit PreA
MADLSIEFCGIKSINPFWLASAPPTDKAYNVVRAFEAGWGGVVWKTLGEDPAAVNVSSRLGALRQEPRSPRLQQHRADYRPLAGNQPARNHAGEEGLAGPRHHRVADAAACEEELWADILPLVEATGADGIELNFGCPHGMPERGMGAAVGQVPEYVEMVTRWCKTHTSCRSSSSSRRHHRHPRTGACRQSGGAMPSR